MRKFIFILFLSICFNTKAQNVFKIYFEYGKSVPKDIEFVKFDNWIQKFDITEIDTIILIGFADSIGKIENNLKLSFKRANSVKKYVNKNYNYGWSIITEAKGEKNKRIEDRDRRVEVRIKLKVSDTLVPIETNINKIPIDNKCYIVDYELLQACFVSYITVKNKLYVKLYLEEQDFAPRKRIKYYYITYDSGKKILNKVKFTQKESGRKWYKRRRYEAIIPRENYLRDKIVYYEKLSCDSCFKDSLEAWNFNKGICFGPDIFLNRNTNFRYGFFNLKYIKIRVPSIFVDSSLLYYDGKTGLKLNWKIKKRKPEFLYSRLDFKGLVTSGIFRKWPCCGLKGWGGFSCATPYIGQFSWIYELGWNQLSKEGIPYAGVGLNASIKNIDLSVLGSISSHFTLSYRAKVKFNIVEIPFVVLNPFQKWKNLESIRGNVLNKTFNLYLGSEYREGFINKYSEQDFYIGISNKYYDYNFFIQYGKGYRFFGQFESSWNRLIQFGVFFNDDIPVRFFKSL